MGVFFFGRGGIGKGILGSVRRGMCRIGLAGRRCVDWRQIWVGTLSRAFGGFFLFSDGLVGRGIFRIG